MCGLTIAWAKEKAIWPVSQKDWFKALASKDQLLLCQPAVCIEPIRGIIAE